MKKEPERGGRSGSHAHERFGGVRVNYLTVIVPTNFGWMVQIYL